MIDADQRAKIRRLFFAEHWRVGTIATELGVHHDTVRRAIEADRFVRPGALVRPSMLDPFKGFIAETLERHPRLRATRLFEMVRGRGYLGSAVRLRRHVATVRPTPKEAFLRLATLPGEQAQVDWGHFGTIRIGHAKRPLSCFVMVLGWSRAMFARFALDQTMESFMLGHVAAFSALGGVPRTILYDNLKSVVLDRAGDHIRFNEAMLLMAGHYHFAPSPARPTEATRRARSSGPSSTCATASSRPAASPRCRTSTPSSPIGLSGWPTPARSRATPRAAPSATPSRRRSRVSSPSRSTLGTATW